MVPLLEDASFRILSGEKVDNKVKARDNGVERRDKLDYLAETEYSEYYQP